MDWPTQEIVVNEAMEKAKARVVAANSDSVQSSQNPTPAYAEYLLEQIFSDVLDSLSEDFELQFRRA